MVSCFRQSSGFSLSLLHQSAPPFLVVLRLMVLLGIVGPAATLQAHGDYHEVVAAVKQELARTPDDAALHFRLALACQEHGEWVDALDALEDVDRLAPGQYPVGLIQAKAMCTGGLWQMARPLLDVLLNENPSHGEALAQRGRVLLKLQEPASALQDFRAALASLRHPDADLFVEVADAMVLHSTAAEGAAVLRAGISRLGAIPALLQKAVEMELATGEVDAALTHLESLKLVLPRPEPCMASQARVLAQAGRGEEATAAWRRLHTHLQALPNLQRGLPELVGLARECALALGQPTAPVMAAPAPLPRTSSR